MSKGRGCSWGTLRIPFGKIGETLGKIRGINTPPHLRLEELRTKVPDGCIPGLTGPWSNGIEYKYIHIEP